MKYKEMLAPEGIEELKVDDLVRVYGPVQTDDPNSNPIYGHNESQVWTIVQMLPSGNVSVSSEDCEGCVHWKQLRKLVPIEAREINYCWFHETGKKGSLYSENHPGGRCDLTRMREVLDDD